MANDIYFNKAAQAENERRFKPVSTVASNPYTEQLPEDQLTLNNPVRSSSQVNSQRPVSSQQQAVRRQTQQTAGRQTQQTANRQPQQAVKRQPQQAQQTTKRKTQDTAYKQPPKSNGKKKKKKKKNKAGRVIAIVLIIVLILGVISIGAAGIAVTYVLGDYEAETLEDNQYVSESSLKSSASVYNILLMGIDNASTSASSRSDSMMILSIDSLHSKLKITSIMRDSYVQIPNDEMAKLNAACTKGGPQLVVDTIEYNFGIKIDAYVKIGYDMLITLVDGIGGITIPEITEKEAQYMGYEGVTVTPGTNVHLDGSQTLQYCRIRKDAATSDFRRTERQREALSIIIKKMMVTNPATLAKVGRTIISTADCSISKAEMTTLLIKALPCLAGDIETGRVPVDGSYTSVTSAKYGSALGLDLETNKQYLIDFIYG